MLIYQVENGDDNSAKSPLGGVIVQSSSASSMAISIANPITFYVSSIINQAGHTKDLYNYYWTSYSRGTDGDSYNGKPNWHNVYLDGYIPLRVKSIYDPCPYLYRIPSNGTYNQFTSNPGWTTSSYLGGVSWNLNTLGESWLSGLGKRSYGGSTVFVETGRWAYYYLSTSATQNHGYTFMFVTDKRSYLNSHGWSRPECYSVRCIEGFNVTFVAPKVTKMPKAKSTSASL